jgi:uncharacterized membrane protein (UPF0127 family)
MHMKPLTSKSADRIGTRWPAPVLALLGLLLGLYSVPELTAADSTRVQVGPATFQVEWARTDPERRRGLMFRKHLPEGQGMLFDQAPNRAEFWMKNTLIPLDLLYFDSSGTLLEVVPDVPPCRQPDCPTYPSRSTAIRYILEINGGLADRLGIQAGDPLRLLP